MLKEFSKICLFLVLFIYLDIAVVLVYMGVSLIISYHDVKGLTTGECENCAVKLISILIAVGVLALTLILTGCTGICGDRKGVLRWFLAFFFILFALEIAGGTVAYYQRHKLENTVRQGMNSTFGKYYRNGTAKNAIDHLQQKEKCCGVNNSTDWSYFNPSLGPFQLPESCCSSSHSGACTTNDSFEMGCYNKICDVYNDNKILILTLTGTFLFFQIVGLLFGLYLSCTMKTITSEERRFTN